MSLFAGILQGPGTSSKLSYCLHTAEVAGSNPASPTLKVFYFSDRATAGEVPRKPTHPPAQARELLDRRPAHIDL